jgi:penicillin-binding protein 2
VWKKLTDDDTDPLMNRAIQSYAPGSTYKAVSGLAGFLKGLTGRTSFHCSGGVSYGAKYMRCWIADKGGSHGSLTLPDALKVSCNSFFYQWGNSAKIENIVALGDALNLGKKTSVPLSGESGGILPGPDWLKFVSPTERWSDGYTANVSIGQGSVEASPLQMAMVTATIANRGISYEPRLVHRVLDQDGRDVVGEDGNLVAPHEPKVRADLHESGITNDQMELIRRGMWKVVNDAGGTGKRAQVKGVEVAGKTGTAQFWRETNGKRIKDNHTWFICFAPYDAPKFAVTVFVQGA